MNLIEERNSNKFKDHEVAKVIQNAWKNYKMKKENNISDLNKIPSRIFTKLKRYNADTCFQHTFSKQSLDEINNRYHNVHGLPNFVHNLIKLREGEHYNLALMKPELISYSNNLLLIPNTSYNSPSELVLDPLRCKSSPGGVGVLGYYIHPKFTNGTIWTDNTGIYNHLIKKLDKMKDISHVQDSLKSFHHNFVRSSSQERISDIEKKTNKKYLVSILNLDVSDIDWLLDIKNHSYTYVKETFGVAEKDNISMYFHFPCAPHSITLHLHVKINAVSHPIEKTRVFLIDEIIESLKAGKSVYDIILERQAMGNNILVSNGDACLEPCLEPTLKGFTIEEIPNPYKIDLSSWYK